jgi:hypothetical protein
VRLPKCRGSIHPAASGLANFLCEFSIEYAQLITQNEKGRESSLLASFPAFEIERSS